MGQFVTIYGYYLLTSKKFVTNIVRLYPIKIVFISQDWNVMLWDLNEGRHLYTLDHKSIINALCFSPNRYWLCAATGPSIKIWVIIFL